VVNRVKIFKFAAEHEYRNSSSGIEVPVILTTDDDRSVRLLAKVDTGAADCIFQRDYAEHLGLEVESGTSKTYSTANRLVRSVRSQIKAVVL